jgi:hypothetical protein
VVGITNGSSAKEKRFVTRENMTTMISIIIIIIIIISTDDFKSNTVRI